MPSESYNHRLSGSYVMGNPTTFPSRSPAHGQTIASCRICSPNRHLDAEIIPRPLQREPAGALNVVSECRHNTNPTSTRSLSSSFEGAGTAESRITDLASRLEERWQVPKTILSLNFKANCITVRVKTERQPETICFSAWPRGDGQTELPTDIWYKSDRAIWGFRIPESSSGWDQYESLKEIMEAASQGGSTITEQDIVILFSQFLTLVFGHIARELLIDLSVCHCSFILPNSWREHENKTFNDIIKKVVQPSTTYSVIRELEAGALSFAKRYPNESGILLMIDDGLMTDDGTCYTVLNDFLDSLSRISIAHYRIDGPMSINDQGGSWETASDPDEILCLLKERWSKLGSQIQGIYVSVVSSVIRQIAQWLQNILPSNNHNDKIVSIEREQVFQDCAEQIGDFIINGPPNVNRRLPRNYGVLIRTPYNNDDVQDEMDNEIEVVKDLDGTYWRNNVVHWLGLKGEQLISGTTRRSVKAYRLFRPNKNPHFPPEIVYACDSIADDTFKKTTRYKSSRDVREIRRMSLDIAQIPTTLHDSADGESYCRVEFQLCLTFNNLNIDFIIEHQGREVQKVQDISYAEQNSTSHC